MMHHVHTGEAVVTTQKITYMEKILSTFQCSWGYGSPIEMGIVSEVSSRP